MNRSGDQTAEKNHVVPPFNDHLRGKEVVPRSVDELTNKQIVSDSFGFAFAIAQIRRVERIPTFRVTDQFGKLSLLIFSRQTNVSKRSTRSDSFLTGQRIISLSRVFRYTSFAIHLSNVGQTDEPAVDERTGGKQRRLRERNRSRNIRLKNSVQH